MPWSSLRSLQLAVALGGLVPVGAGLTGVLLGPSMPGGVVAVVSGSIELDSHFRYLSGLLLGVGLAFWCLIPGIAQHGHAFRLLAALVVIGGFGRLVGVLSQGVPQPPMLFALAMELLVTPLLCLWQACLASAAGAG